MPLARSVIAADPRSFGRALLRDLPAPARLAPSIAEDLKLFALTFLGGFVFVSVLIA
jgi:hypothetical protein